MLQPNAEPVKSTVECPLVLGLDRLSRHDVARAGGKGASLGEMVRSGLPVPKGFAVLTDAYRAFVSHSGLHDEIQRLARAAPAEDLEALEEGSRQIRRLFEGETVPEHVEHAIVEAYDALGLRAVAVRSSATAEDLPGASFAGQHDSFLNIEGAEAVCAAVKRCWASLWNARALSYRRRRGMHLEDVAIAVVVQRMLDAERAGVLFTANPLNHRRDQMLLSASWGLGEAVVGGEVDPDQWVVDAESGRILDTRIAEKRVVTVRGASGTLLGEMPAHQRTAPTLGTGEVAELVALGKAAAAHFGSPQDIEWAWAEGRPYLVQSRPITALFPLPEPLPDPSDGLRLYICASVHAQQMVEPLTPAGIEWWRALVAGFAHAATGEHHPDVSWYKVAAGRMFIDVTELLRKPKRWRQLGEALRDKDPITTQALYAFGEREGDAIIGKGRGFRIPLRLIPLAVRLAYRAAIAALAPSRARERIQRETDEAIEALNDEATRLSGVTERVDFIEEVLARRGAMIWLMPVAVMAPGLSAEDGLRSRLERWFGHARDLRPIQRALPHNPTTQMGLQLWQLARRLWEQGAEPTADHPGVAAFLKRHRHRAVWEIDPGMPRWSEDPTYVLGVLRGYLRQQEGRDQELLFQTHADEAGEAADALVSRVRTKKGRVQAWVVRRLINVYRALGGLREQPKFDGARLIASAREILHEAGRELVNLGLLDDAEDVFFLTFDELRAADAAGESAVDLRARATEARQAYRQELERRAVPRWMTSTGECLFAHAAPETEGGLSGLPVSPGVYDGTARIVLDPVSARLAPGDVLVCQGTDPAWTPLFLTAGALVMETGGAVSHGSVVAREYGIPAVAGVPGATQRLHDGQRVRVDGENGQVTVLA